jgi:glycerophosphoryl diester phosphodiesterase
MNLSRAAGAPLVIGHRGAAAIAPENTLESLQAGVAAGADLIEFDIGPDLRLAHSDAEVPGEQLSLDDALEYLRSTGVGVHLDVKLTGYEAAVVEAVRRHAVADRAVISTTWLSSTRRLERLAPDLPRALGYPHDRYGVNRFRWPEALQRGGVLAFRQLVPTLLPAVMRRAHANVLSLHHTLCSPRAVATSHRLGAPVLAWTVNDAAAVRRLAAAGVDAIVSDDPEMARNALATLAAS